MLLVLYTGTTSFFWGLWKNNNVWFGFSPVLKLRSSLGLLFLIFVWFPSSPGVSTPGVTTLFQKWTSKENNFFFMELLYLPRYTDLHRLCDSIVALHLLGFFMSLDLLDEDWWFVVVRLLTGGQYINGAAHPLRMFFVRHLLPQDSSKFASPKRCKVSLLHGSSAWEETYVPSPLVRGESRSHLSQWSQNTGLEGTSRIVWSNLSWEKPGLVCGHRAQQGWLSGDATSYCSGTLSEGLSSMAGKMLDRTWSPYS